MKRLRSRRGESIIEALISVAIIALTFCLIAQAILASAKINARAGMDDAAMRYDGAKRHGEITIYIGSDMSRAILWETEHDDGAGPGYFYYESVESANAHEG
ncbi:MAG: hypothetical protein IJ617_01670 [Oscillospiraceae bacterium]|nr:hypothetical protein [Oscillospiraceae bacterium]